MVKKVKIKKKYKKKGKVIKTSVIDTILLQPPRGMRDILPEDQPYWEHIRKIYPGFHMNMDFRE